MGQPVYIVTGSAGHLGSTLVGRLAEEGAEVRGLILPGEQGTVDNATYVEGDVCRPDSLLPLWEGLSGREVILIHGAGIVDISGKMPARMYHTNVGGTRNILDLCRRMGVARLVYVSSVHAIPESGPFLEEVDSFSPDRVVGGYAKTKAQAAQAVLDAATRGLDAVVVHPSGILGPNDGGGNHLVEMVRGCLDGSLPVGVRGGYDFVDVRDVAAGCIAAARQGRKGECYVLSNDWYTIADILSMACSAVGGRRVVTVPMWAARAAAPIINGAARLRGRRPLYTGYSLHTLSTGCRFSHEKADRELGYHTRPMEETVRDTVEWLRSGPGSRPPVTQ